MIIEFQKGTKFKEIKSILSKFEEEYDITLFCASTWQTTDNKENYTAFECTKKDNGV